MPYSRSAMAPPSIGGGNLLISRALKRARIICEEVFFQSQRDFEKKLRVDTVAGKDIIDVAAVAVYFAGEPRNRALLATELQFDKATD